MLTAINKYTNLVTDADLFTVILSGLHDPAEGDEPLVLKDVTNIEGVVVPNEVVPLVHVDPRVLIRHNLVEEAFGLGPAFVVPH